MHQTAHKYKAQQELQKKLASSALCERSELIKTGSDDDLLWEIEIRNKLKVWKSQWQKAAQWRAFGLR
jgi:hypothetical protein